MFKYSDFVGMLNDAQNMIDSLKLSVERNAKFIRKVEAQDDKCSAEVIEDLVNQNSESALAIMYLTSLLEELHEQTDAVKLVTNLLYDAVAEETFNKRFEEVFIGHEE